jgi:hypothetical protein
MESDEMSEPQQPPQTSNWDGLTSLRFPGNQPSKEASARLYDELQFQRACQVYLWALPAINMVAMRDGQAAAFGSGNNVLAIWKDRISAKTIISTANPDVIYGLAFVDLKDGPRYSRVERQRLSVGGLRLRQLFRVPYLAGLLQCVTVLNPDGRIAGIPVKSLPVEHCGKLPLRCVSGAIGESDDVRPPTPRYDAQHLSHSA